MNLIIERTDADGRPCVVASDDGRYRWIREQGELLHDTVAGRLLGIGGYLVPAPGAVRYDPVPEDVRNAFIEFCAQLVVVIDRSTKVVPLRP